MFAPRPRPPCPPRHRKMSWPSQLTAPKTGPAEGSSPSHSNPLDHPSLVNHVMLASTSVTFRIGTTRSTFTADNLQVLDRLAAMRKAVVAAAVDGTDDEQASGTLLRAAEARPMPLAAARRSLARAGRVVVVGACCRRAAHACISSGARLVIGRVAERLWSIRSPSCPIAGGATSRFLLGRRHAPRQRGAVLSVKGQSPFSSRVRRRVFGGGPVQERGGQGRRDRQVQPVYLAAVSGSLNRSKFTGGSASQPRNVNARRLPTGGGMSAGSGAPWAA